MNLHQTYGQRAGAQIAQLQSGSQSRVPPPSAAPTSSYIKQEDGCTGFDGIQDYAREVKLPAQPLNTSQTDGGGDMRHSWETEYARRKPPAAGRVVESDNLIRAHFLTRQQELEGGGLLAPLDERQIPSKSTTRKVNELGAVEGHPSNKHTHGITRAQGDAAGDEDDEDDEDAINSDLDDPDDLAAAEENGENTDQVMLCTYDKVQVSTLQTHSALTAVCNLPLLVPPNTSGTNNEMAESEEQVEVYSEGWHSQSGRQRVSASYPPFAGSIRYDVSIIRKNSLTIPFTRYVFHKGQGEFEW